MTQLPPRKHRVEITATPRMTQLPPRKHRVEITATPHKDGSRTIEARLTMAVAYRGQAQDWPGQSEMVNMIAIGARAGLLQALDDINREDIRKDLKDAINKART